MNGANYRRAVSSVTKRWRKPRKHYLFFLPELDAGVSAPGVATTMFRQPGWRWYKMFEKCEG
ncbi:MAG TPA: hypothetical protein PLB71_07950 [Methanoculleus sp.]|uniref:hypothetical protein n=1 Tax=Methanoculleus sp. TaxID=90427 RepID=UPI002C75E9E2|nr:hypothetical protein [Methanoculleus sp.]HQL59846.1 hypothetical protein [Methanoculleus sp.]